MNAVVAFLATNALDHNPAWQTSITVGSGNTRQTLTLSRDGIARYCTAASALTRLTSSRSVVPEILLALITAPSSDTRLAATLSCRHITVATQRSLATITRFAATSRVKAKVTRSTSVAMNSNNISLALTGTGLMITEFRTQLVAGTFLAGFLSDGITEVPVHTTFTVISKSLMKAIETLSSPLIAAQWVTRINVSIALTLLATTTGHQRIAPIANVTALTPWSRVAFHTLTLSHATIPVHVTSVSKIV